MNGLSLPLRLIHIFIWISWQKEIYDKNWIFFSYQSGWNHHNNLFNGHEVKHKHYTLELFPLLNSCADVSVDTELNQRDSLKCVNKQTISHFPSRKYWLLTLINFTFFLLLTQATREVKVFLVYLGKTKSILRWKMCVMEFMVRWSRIFNVNKAAEDLIPEENEKWFSCCGGGEVSPQVVTMHDYQVRMRTWIAGLGLGSINYSMQINWHVSNENNHSMFLS